MTGTPVLRAVIYARLSNAKTNRAEGRTEGDASDSIENQVKALMALAAREGYVLVAPPYIDDGFSGFKSVERPAFSRLQQDMAKGQFDIILVRSGDRLSRNNETGATFRTLCEVYSVRWQTADGSITDPTTADGGLMATVVGALAHHESAVKRERLLMHYEGARNRGESIPAHRTFGWADDRVSEHLTEADEVRRMFAAVADGASVGSIVRDLNARKVPQARGGAGWQYATVTAILENRRYYGASVERVRIGKDKTGRDKCRRPQERAVIPGVIGKWAHLIDEATFEDVQDKLRKAGAKNGRKSGTYFSTRHLLGGLLRCGVCGGPMRSSSTTDRQSGSLVGVYRCEANRGLPEPRKEEEGQQEAEQAQDGQQETRTKDGRRHASLRILEVDEAARRSIVDAFVYGTDDVLEATATDADPRPLRRQRAELEEDVQEVWRLRDSGHLTRQQAAQRITMLGERRDAIDAELDRMAEQSTAAHMVVDLRRDVLSGRRVDVRGFKPLKAELRKRLDGLNIDKQRQLATQHLIVTATGGRSSARNPRRFRIEHLKVVSLNAESLTRKD